jgi:nucleoid-associated protein EbfC
MAKNMLGDLMKQAQAMQEKLAKLQAEAGNKTVEGTAGGGMVAVTANGRQEIVGIKIAPEVINPQDPEMLQDLVTAAVNDALKKSKELMAEELKGLTGGFPVPGLF